MPRIEIIPVGEIDDELLRYYNWTNTLIVDVNNTSETLIEIMTGRRKEKTTFIFKIANANGESCSMNKCLLRGDHLIATAITLLDKEEIDGDTEIKQLKTQIGSKKRFGKMLFLDQTELIDRGDITKRLWQRYLKKLDKYKKDFLEQEEDFDDRYDRLVATFKGQVNKLRQMIVDLQNQNIAQLVVLSNNVVKILQSQIIDEILASKIDSDELKDDLLKLKTELKQIENIPTVKMTEIQTIKTSIK